MIPVLYQLISTDSGIFIHFLGKTNSSSIWHSPSRPKKPCPLMLWRIPSSSWTQKARYSYQSLPLPSGLAIDSSLKSSFSTVKSFLTALSKHHQWRMFCWNIGQDKCYFLIFGIVKSVITSLPMENVSAVDGYIITKQTPWYWARSSWSIKLYLISSGQPYLETKQSWSKHEGEPNLCTMGFLKTSTLTLILVLEDASDLLL